MTGIDRGISFKAAERFEVHFEDMSIPISIKELNDWAIHQGENNSELATWLNLLGFESRTSLANFLQTPFSVEKEVALQLLRSWYGRKLFEEIGQLVRLDEDKSGIEIFNTLEKMLESSRQLNVLYLFQSLPAEVIHLDLDGVVKVANRWRRELKLQQKLVADLSSISEKPSESVNSIGPKLFKKDLKESFLRNIPLEVSHRDKPLNIEIWKPANNSLTRSNLIVFMPGLGGDQDHFRWLSRILSYHGWPTVLIEHPGSDSEAIKALLDGSLPVPGLEVIPERLADLQGVLSGIEQGILKVPGKNIVLMGHSLGSLTAFLASGAEPQRSLKESCSKALNDFSLTNLSELLQCQFTDFAIPSQKPIKNLRAIVGINSFGSLLWPKYSTNSIDVPVFLVGGTFDLVTPAISEQLGLLLSIKPNPLNRVLLIEGASHFSPVRVKGQINNEIGDDIFKLKGSLVGLHPLSVQSLIANEIIKFLDNLEEEEAVPAELNIIYNGTRFHLLDRPLVKELLKS